MVGIRKKEQSDIAGYGDANYAVCRDCADAKDRQDKAIMSYDKYAEPPICDVCRERLLVVIVGGYESQEIDIYNH